MEEACFNGECDRYTYRGEFLGNLAERSGFRRAEKLWEGSIREFYQFNPKFLFQKIHGARAAEYVKLLGEGGTNIDTVVSLNYLMTRLHGNAMWGASCDYRACRVAFSRYYGYFLGRKSGEDICSKYCITTKHGRQFVIKYHHALDEFFRSYGIISNDDKLTRADALPFYHVDKKSTGAPARSVFDFGAIYKNSLPFVTCINHAFKMRPSMSKMHEYPSESEEIIALLSLWINCPPGCTVAIDAKHLREIYDGAAKLNKMGGDFDRFLEDYTSGKTYAPILIFDGEKYHFDYAALLVHLIYLFSNNRSLSGMQTETGRAAHDKNRQNPARYFEAEIRQKLRDDGFDVRPRQDGKQFSPSFDGKRREFDCIAVDVERRIIVIVEAKYEDMAPSSMAAGTMVDQLVLDEKSGLLAHAKDHHSRLVFFRMHFCDMKKRGLDLPGGFSDYAVRALVVTKHEPLISRYKDIDIVSYKEFMSTDFRSPTARDGLVSTAPESALGPPAAQAAGSCAAGETAQAAPRRSPSVARPHRGASRERRG